MKQTTEWHEASCSLFATAELLVMCLSVKAGQSRHNVFFCYQSSEHNILKMNGPILMQIVAGGQWANYGKWHAYEKKKNGSRAWYGQFWVSGGEWSRSQNAEAELGHIVEASFLISLCRVGFPVKPRLTTHQSHLLSLPNLHSATSEMWCWSQRMGISTELSLLQYCVPL